MVGRITARTTSTWDDVALQRLGRPLRFVGCIVAARMLDLTRRQAEGFYADHRERPFFRDLCA